MALSFLFLNVPWFNVGLCWLFAQLGLGDTKDRHSPVQLEKCVTRRVVSIAYGAAEEVVYDDVDIPAMSAVSAGMNHRYANGAVISYYLLCAGACALALVS